MRFSIFKRNLVSKIILIFAPIFLVFFIVIGVLTKNMLERQIFKNTDEILNALIIAESDQINKHFRTIKNMCEIVGLPCSAKYGEDLIENMREKNTIWNQQKIINIIKQLNGNFNNVKQYSWFYAH